MIDIALLLVIAGLLVERYFTASEVRKDREKLLDELSKAVKAVISKNANEYVMTTSIDKVPVEDKPPKDPDEIELDTLNDDEFDKAIGIKRTPPKK